MKNQTQVPVLLIFGMAFEQPAVTNWAMELKKFSFDNPGRPLELVYCSVGGNIQEARFVREWHHWLMRRGHHLTTCTFGCSASCTSWVARASRWVKIGRDSELLIHRVKPCKCRTLNEMEQEVVECHRLERITFGHFIKGSSISMTRVRAETADGNWIIGAREAIKLGLANEIVPESGLKPISLANYQAQQAKKSKESRNTQRG
jgi:ATP-dependent protease ClpP protease subunit